MCENGFKLGKSLAIALVQRREYIFKDPQMNKIFFNPVTNQSYVENDIIKMPHLARTLRMISEDPEDFYKGPLSGLMVAEINQNGGNVTLEDFKSYKADVFEVQGVELKDGYKIYTLPPPSGGLLIAFIVNVMKGFDFPLASQMNNQTLTTFYHRLIETFKHAFAKRTHLGDPSFVNVTKVG